LSLHIAALIAIVGAQVWLYPALATAIFGMTGGTTGPGSSMGYFRDHYVLAAAILFVLAAATAFGLAARVGAPVLRRVVIVGWILNIVALVGSSLWYFHAVQAAAGAGGP
jgi:hypothetical protein